MDQNGEPTAPATEPEATDETHSEHTAKDAVKEKIGQAKDYVGERYQAVSDKVRDQYETASSEAKKRYDDVRSRVEHVEVDDVLDQLRDYVRSNPGKALLISVGIGFVIGLVMRGGEDDEE